MIQVLRAVNCTRQELCNSRICTLRDVLISAGVIDQVINQISHRNFTGNDLPGELKIFDCNHSLFKSCCEAFMFILKHIVCMSMSVCDAHVSGELVLVLWLDYAAGGEERGRVPAMWTAGRT